MKLRTKVNSRLYFMLQVFDATNSTTDRREMIKNIVVDKMGYKLFFVESVCDDPKLIEQNIMVSFEFNVSVLTSKLPSSCILR